jgi:lysozyme
MEMSEHGRELLAQWEGFKQKVYKDAVGKATIGVGHLLTGAEKSSGSITINGECIDYSGGITKEQVLGLLAQDLGRFEKAINDNVTVSIKQNQFDALVAFCFNVGVGAFTDSTLLKKLNDGSYDAVPDQLMKWTKGGGKTLPGLVNRRQHEIDLWNEGA